MQNIHLHFSVFTKENLKCFTCIDFTLSSDIYEEMTNDIRFSKVYLAENFCRVAVIVRLR